MRLSTAIGLGRTLVHPIPGIVLDYGGLNGCALGMGYKANGGEIDCRDLDPGIGMDKPMEVWPWLTSYVLRPCGCYLACILNAGQTIAHLFDYHVMGSEFGLSEGEGVKQPWTLDQLIDWIASVEPAEAPAAPLEHLLEHQAAEPIPASAANSLGVEVRQ